MRSSSGRSDREGALDGIGCVSIAGTSHRPAPRAHSAFDTKDYRRRGLSATVVARTAGGRLSSPMTGCARACAVSDPAPDQAGGAQHLDEGGDAEGFIAKPAAVAMQAQDGDSAIRSDDRPLGRDARFPQHWRVLDD